MEKWEYLTEIVGAHIDNPGAKEYLSREWPNWKPKKFSPETMIPRLDSLGDKGWELVHMEPIAGEEKDGRVDFAGSQSYVSNAYFCVFKRRKQ